ncbi:MAG: phospholipase [Brachymonas sp.]|nr:phospholipase [Brachymonas sp.]
MQALNIFAGPAALQHIRTHGLLPQHVGAIAAAAGGPKGLMLLRMDRLLFGDWLKGSTQPVHLVGASIGAWRMATACLDNALAGFELLEQGYIHGEMKPRKVGGKWRLPHPADVSASFTRNLQACFGDKIETVLHHPRYRLHVFTSRGRHLLGRDTLWRSVPGYLAAYATNAVHRPALGGWLERVVFSSSAAGGTQPGPLPFDASDYRTRHVALTHSNFMPAMQASGSIPFVLQGVHDIPGAPRGAYWDGGLTDYHLHLRFFQGQAAPANGAAPLVLYPHFQQAVVPGWLDKQWRGRHRSTSALDHMVLLAPKPEWVANLPNAKLPDRNDFKTHMHDHDGRVAIWTQAVAASQQLADEFAQWLQKPDPSRVQAL